MSAGQSLSLLLSYPPCQHFKSKMAHSAPDKKGQITFSDAASSRGKAGTLSQGVPEPQVAGRQTNTRWQPFVTNYETPSAVVGGGRNCSSKWEPLWSPFSVLTGGSLQTALKESLFCTPDGICHPHSHIHIVEYHCFSRRQNISNPFYQKNEPLNSDEQYFEANTIQNFRASSQTVLSCYNKNNRLVQCSHTRF